MVQFLCMFSLLLNGNVTFNQMKERGGAPISEARKQHLHRSKVASSPSQCYLLWPKLGAMQWMGEAVLVFG